MRGFISLFENRLLFLLSLLVFFHFIIAMFMNLIANSSYLLPLHNGHGLWSFSLDSISYDIEAQRLLLFLDSGDIDLWWNGNQQFYHVRWIALSYFLLGVNPFSFELFNGPVWALSFICSLMLCKLVGEKFNFPKYISYAPAIVFSLLPSYLLSSTQLLKDPIYILGLLCMFLGWVMLFRNTHKWWPIFLIGIGFLLSVLIRPYLSDFFYCTLIFSLILLVWIRSEGRSAVILTMLTLSLCVFYLPTSTSTSTSTSTGGLLKQIVNKLGTARLGFSGAYLDSKSAIDSNVKFESMKDIIGYIPRAYEIGFLAPFPNLWFSSGRNTGKVGRMMSGAETLLLYFLLFGTVFFLYCYRSQVFILFLPILLSIGVILLLGLIVNNVGALYRMRTGFLLPFYIMGVYGLYELKDRVIYLIRNP